MSQFVRQEQVSLELGPQQLALAVAEDDLAQMTLAMRAASSMWGGRRFPILAVTEAGEVSDSGGGTPLLDILDVSTVIDFTGKLAPAGLVRTEGERRVPVMPAQPLEDHLQWSPSQLVSHTLEQLEGKVVLEAATEDPVLVAAVGRMACRTEVDTWVEFGANVEAVSDTALFAAQAEGRSVIDATAHALPTTLAVAPFMTSLVFVYVVGDEPSFEDLHVFWNTRAVRMNERGKVLLLPAKEVLSNTDGLVHLVHRTAQSNPSLSLASCSVPLEELRELQSAVGIPPHAAPKWTENPLLKQPIEPTSALNLDPRGYWTGRRNVGVTTAKSVALYEPKTSVEFDSPLQFAPAFWGQPVELRLRSGAFEVPPRPAVAKLFLPNAVGWSGSALRLRNRLERRYGFELRLPRGDEVLTAAVELPYTPSDKARQLRAVLQRDAGALDLYRDRVIISVIEALAPADSRHLKRALDKLDKVDEADKELLRSAAASLKDQVRTLDEVRSALKPPGAGASANDVAAALTALADRGHVQRGMRADCTLCDTRDLRQLDDAPAAPKCRACGAPASYSLGAKGEPALYYRLSPVMRLTNANGGLPVLAAAAVLDSEGAHLVPGVNGSTDGDDFEVDLLGWVGKKVLAGEVKRLASGFTDVDGDVRNSARFGADVHIAATLDTIEGDLRAELEVACAAEKLELRILDATQLLAP
jgi:hypothetical protein